MEAVEPASIGHKAPPLLLEDFPRCPLTQLGMRVPLGPGDTAVLKLGVKLGVALEPRPRHEEPPANHADLVLDLALLPENC